VRATVLLRLNARRLFGWRGRPETTPDGRWETIPPGHRHVLAAFLRLVPRGGRLLDAGSGTGKYWPFFQAAGLAVTGVDRCPNRLRRAQERVPDAELVCRPLQEYHPAPAAFDAVWCCDVMECLPPEDWPVVLTRLVRALRPGGVIMVNFEAPGPLRLRLRHRLVGRPLLARRRRAPHPAHHLLHPYGYIRRTLRRLPVKTLDWQVGDGYRFWLARRL